MAERRDKATWAALGETFEASGKSSVAFCKRRGISPRTRGHAMPYGYTTADRAMAPQMADANARP